MVAGGKQWEAEKVSWTEERFWWPLILVWAEMVNQSMGWIILMGAMNTHTEN